MENIELQVTEDDRLIITVDLKKVTGWTTKRRSVRVASTQGNLPLWKNGQPHPSRVRLNLNLFRPLTKDEEREFSEKGVLWFET